MYYNRLISDSFYVDSIGMWITVEATPENIASIRFMDNTGAKETITLAVSVDLLRYFEGEQVDFSSYHVDLSAYSPFQRQVLTAARSVPWGACITYSRLAQMVGRPKAARAVGNVLSMNRVPVIIPCHRVVSNHGVGGYSCGVDLKLKLLGIESIEI